MRQLFCHLGFLSFKQTGIKLSVSQRVNQTNRGTCYSAFLTGLIHCTEIMLIVGDREGSLKRLMVRRSQNNCQDSGKGGLIFPGIIKGVLSWVVFFFIYILKEIYRNSEKY